MWRTAARALWWVLAYDRPDHRRDYAGLLVLFGLLVLGAVALSWLWLVVEVPRSLAAGFSVVQSTIVGWVEQLRSALPRMG